MKSSLRAAAQSQNAFDDFASLLRVVLTYVRSLEGIANYAYSGGISLQIRQ
jgi:hypothetical protein